jgi:hypothetical protein
MLLLLDVSLVHLPLLVECEVRINLLPTSTTIKTSDCYASDDDIINNTGLFWAYFTPFSGFSNVKMRFSSRYYTGINVHESE